jgi:gluconate 2-dehydrogenase gamma chain
MANDEDRTGFVSRRELLRSAGLAAGMAGAAAALPATALAQTAALQRGPLETLTEAEADTLDAIVARLIPSDASGPGATEARAARYIDRALGGFLASSREAYRVGLAGVESYARASKGAPFTRLSPADQDAVLGDIERNAATGFPGSAVVFFNLVLAHTREGTFGDPFYGGNDRFVGWDMIGYPGIRLTASAGDQRLDAAPTPTHIAAYDFSMFAKKKPDHGH